MRGADIERWSAIPEIYVLGTQNQKTRSGYEEKKIKLEWPRTFGYLTRFKHVLVERVVYKKHQPDNKATFYSQYNIADYSFSRYKVVWKRMANDTVAAVISQYKTAFGYKTLVPTDTISLFALDNESEAHYLCAIINSRPIREFVKSYSSACRGFGAPSVMNHIGIPKFDPQNELHQQLAQAFIKLQEFKVRNSLGKISELEGLNDELVKKLFGLNKGSG